MRREPTTRPEESQRPGPLVTWLAESSLRLSTPLGVAVGIAAGLVVILADSALSPQIALVSPLALVAVFIGWTSTRSAWIIAGLIDALMWSGEKMLTRSAELLPVTLGMAGLRAATLLILAAFAWELRRTLDHIRDQSLRDALTGILNRRGFFEFAEREVARSRRDGTPFTLAILDIDGFKEINDTYGHHVDDEILRRFADHCTQRLRVTDIVARTGGDEFTLVLPLDAARAEAVIREVVSVPAADGGPELKLSAGAVSYAEAPLLLDLALREADAQMYEAKRSGAGVLLRQGAAG